MDKKEKKKQVKLASTRYKLIITSFDGPQSLKLQGK